MGKSRFSGVRGREKRARVNYELRVAFLLLGAVDCLLLASDCLLHLRGVRVVGTRAPLRSLRQDVTAGRERKN